jgi:hypothetical protein
VVRGFIAKNAHKKEAVMAGTFTHWMVVEEALDRYNKLPSKHKYFPILLTNSHYVTLGAVGPDYPYLSELAKNFLKHHSWANRMHYENAGEFIRQGIKNLSILQNRDFEVCLPWFCGYVTHMLADSIIHPVVNAIVGPYIFNADEHRHCEMIQDSFIFHHVKGVELGYADYVGLIEMCSDPEDENRIHPAIGAYWMMTLKTSHPGGKNYFDTISPDDWHEHFMSMIRKVSDPFPIFRHIGEKTNLVYKQTRDITVEERKRFIAEIKLPGNKMGKFKEEAFDKAVNIVVEVWQKLFADVEGANADNSISYLKNWNFDTGVDEDKIYFWS